MKTLILFRHAKSSWDRPELPDHKRPLAKRGKKAAPLMGKFMKKRGLAPELILCSTAKRTRKTLKLALKAMDEKIDVRYEDRLYLEGPEAILELAAKTPAEIESLMIVGHNPDMEDLAAILTGRDVPHPKFSTAAVAVIELDIADWKELPDARGELKLFRTPKMLEEA